MSLSYKQQLGACVLVLFALLEVLVIFYVFVVAHNLLFFYLFGGGWYSVVALMFFFILLAAPLNLVFAMRSLSNGTFVKKKEGAQ